MAESTITREMASSREVIQLFNAEAIAAGGYSITTPALDLTDVTDSNLLLQYEIVGSGSVVLDADLSVNGDDYCKWSEWLLTEALTATSGYDRDGKGVLGLSLSDIPLRWIKFRAEALGTLAFTSGSTEITSRQMIVGDTSDASAIVYSVSVTSGTWAGGDAAGNLLVHRVRGTFEAEDISLLTSSNVASIGAAPTGDSVTCSMWLYGENIA